METLLSTLSKKEIQEFIQVHEKDDVQKLLLKHKSILGVPTKYIAEQIEARRKAQKKLPSLYVKSGVIYPPSLNLEQSSSEVTAQFKLKLLHDLFQARPSVADLTGGFGIDTYFLSKYASKVHYVEPDLELLQIAKHNHELLGISNVVYHNLPAESFLSSTGEIPDFLFIDPSRRKEAKKVFKLADCEPDVTALQIKYFKKAKHILIKTSPLLDIKQACAQLENVKTIHVVAVENECRELLFHIQPGFVGEPTIHAVDIKGNGQINDSVFTFKEENKFVSHFSTPLNFLFEPNAAILKAGAFKWVAEHCGILKLAPSTHLYTADQIIQDFPGRIFKVVSETKLDKSLIKLFPKGFANILTRNYPLSVEEIKKKTGLREGGELYLICTQSEKQKFVLRAERIK